MTAADHLREAAKHVRDAVQQLNTNAHDCPQCGSNIKEDWDEFRIYQQFVELPKKLRESANRLDNTTRRQAAKED